MSATTLGQLARGEVGLDEALALSADEIEKIWKASTALLIAGDYARALAAFESLAILAGPRADVCMASAACCEALGQSDRARRYYQDALALAPSDALDDVRKVAQLMNFNAKPEVGA